MKRGKPLKRTPISRGTKPLRRTAPTPRTKRVNARSKTKARVGEISPEVSAKVRWRNGGVCERCQNAPGTDLHHRVFRSRGGPGDEFNLVHLCSSCHHGHAHSENEYPWTVPGFFIGGRYVGPDEEYRAKYGPGETLDPRVWVP